jgi:hypothetical protein
MSNNELTGTLPEYPYGSVRRMRYVTDVYMSLRVAAAALADAASDPQRNARSSQGTHHGEQLWGCTHALKDGSAVCACNHGVRR